MIKTEIFRLFGSIFVDNEEANKSISKTEEKAQSLGSRLGEGVKTAAKWGAGLLAAGTTAATGMIALANKTAESADEIDKMAERTGIGRERLQELRYAAGQSDVEFSVLEKAVKKMSETSVLAADGSKKASEAFDMLGISLHNTDGTLKSTNQLFEESMNALADMEEGVQRNYIGNQIFGRGFTEMLPLLNAGSDGIQELSDRAHELGLVMSEEAVIANVKFGDTMADIKDSFGAVFMHITNQFLPILQVFIDFILDNMPQIQAVFTVVFNTIGMLASSFIEVIQWIIGWVQQWVTDNAEQLEHIKNLFMSFFTAVKGFITSFISVAVAFWQQYGDNIMGIISTTFEFIKSTIDTVLKVVIEIFNAFAAVFRGDWEALGESIKKIWKALWDWIGSLGKTIYNIGKNIVQALWDGIKDMWGRMTSWVGDKVKSLLNSLNPFKGSSVTVSGPSIPAMATGGTVLQSGMALVGEAGPELLYLPRGAQVKPLTGESIDYDRLEAIAYASFYDAFVDALKTLGKGELRINIDGRTLAREMIPRIIAENQRMGVVTT